MSEGPPLFTVPEMADFLFGDTSAAACAAAHRLLRTDALHFKQVGRSPPVFSPRPEAEVEGLRRELEAAAAEEARLAAFAGQVAAAAAVQRAERPDRASWLSGPHALTLSALETYALSPAAPTGAGGEATPTAGVALQALQVHADVCAHSWLGCREAVGNWGWG
jgi:hypothetical protein